MSINSSLILFLLQFVLDTHGQPHNKQFRDDYTFIEETQSYYKYFSNSKTWHDALTTCAREGATLFYAEDKDEFEAVAKFWTQFGDVIFVGISSFFSKGVFTSYDNKPLTDIYNNWFPGKPDDKNGEGNCVIMSKRGQMEDLSCTQRWPFICKKTSTNVVWHHDCETPYDGYVLNEDLGRCYKFFLTPMNWTEALAVCNAEESYLAIINSKQEADYLKKLTEDAPKDKVRGDYTAGVVMLGFGNRFKQGWLSVKGATLEASGYSHWGYAQPDVDNKDLCGAMFYNGELTYSDCSPRSFFICEKEYTYTRH
ncbi:macrophage mannose receptor 1 isoform X1 [Manduca sexta]|uniref:macrophage mannose receptor 1 isoform X1 n=1 Tax=Manduca sexta TaxID=7130 RepID=UPI00188FD256|nr:macrophage mannose receptor 1 isoform X1 [Manduca sexta]